MNTLFRPRIRLLATIAALFALALLATACGNGGSDDTAANAGVVTAADVTAEMESMAADEHTVADRGAAAHAHEEAADEQDAVATDAPSVDRTITVLAREFEYDDSTITVKVGETVRLVLVNEGTVLHDITSEQFVGTAVAAGTAIHDMSNMADEEGHGADPTFHGAAESGDSVEIIFSAAEAGEFELFCTVPGHRELGMTGTLVVEDA